MHSEGGMSLTYPIKGVVLEYLYFTDRSCDRIPFVQCVVVYLLWFGGQRDRIGLFRLLRLFRLFYICVHMWATNLTKRELEQRFVRVRTFRFGLDE